MHVREWITLYVCVRVSVRVNVHVCTCVCMHVRVHAGAYARMYVCASARMHICTFSRVSRMHVFTDPRMHACTNTHSHICTHYACTCARARVYTCMSEWIYLCTYAHVRAMCVQAGWLVRMHSCTHRHALSISCLHIYIACTHRIARARVHACVRDSSSAACQPITVPMCARHISWNMTSLPNAFGHTTQKEAADHSYAWAAHVSVHCHPVLQEFLCTLYTPRCTPGSQHTPLKYVTSAP